VEIHWEEPHAATWASGFVADQVKDLVLDNATFDAAPGSAKPVLRLNDADGVTLRDSQIASVRVTGGKSQAVRLIDTESNVTAGPEVRRGTVPDVRPLE